MSLDQIPFSSRFTTINVQPRITRNVFFQISNAATIKTLYITNAFCKSWNSRK